MQSLAWHQQYIWGGPLGSIATWSSLTGPRVCSWDSNDTEPAEAFHVIAQMVNKGPL